MTTNPFHVLHARPLEVSTQGPPDRRLIVEAGIPNPGSIPCVILSSWIEAHFSPGDGLVEGPLLRQFHAQAREAILPVHGELRCDLRLPVSTGLLGAIERARSDGVTVEVTARVLLAPVVETGEQAVLGKPWEAGVFGPPGYPFRVSIARSDWIKYLGHWQWSQIELFEFPFDLRLESPALVRAFELLRTAEERYRHGDFTGTFQNCWQALESLAVDTGQGGSKENAYSRLLEVRLQGEEKRKRVNALLFALNKFGHLGRHEDRPREELLRQDALFILRTSLATISYLGGQ